MDEDGSVYDTTKYGWLQGRQVDCPITYRLRAQNKIQSPVYDRRHFRFNWLSEVGQGDCPLCHIIPHLYIRSCREFDQSAMVFNWTLEELTDCPNMEHYFEPKLAAGTQLFHTYYYAPIA